jgi:hypothetical protein
LEEKKTAFFGRQSTGKRLFAYAKRKLRPSTVRILTESPLRTKAPWTVKPDALRCPPPPNLEASSVVSMSSRSVRKEPMFYDEVRDNGLFE